MLIKNTTQNQNHHQQKPNNDCWGMSIGSTLNIVDQLAQRQQNLNTNGTAATKTIKEQQKQPTSKQTLTSKQLQNPLAANTLNQQQLSSLEVEGNVPRQIAKTAIAMANAGPLAAGFHQPLRSKYEFTEARHCPSNAKQQQPSMSTTNSLRRRSKVSGASMSPSPQTSLSPKNAAAAGLRRVSEDFRLQKQRRSMGNILTKTTNVTDSMPVLRSNDNRNGTIAETTEIMSNVVDHTTMANGISAGDRHNVANGEIGSNFSEFQQMITVDSDGSATGAIIDGYIDDDYGELMDLQQDMCCERRRASCNDATMYSFNHNTRLEYTTSTESTSSSSSAGIDPKRLRPTSVESSSTGCSLLNPNHSSLPFVFQPRQSVTTPGTTTTTTTTSTSAAFLTTTGEEDSFSSMIAADPFYAATHCRINNESMSDEDDYMFRINGAVSNGGASAPTSPVSVPKTAASTETRKSFCSTNARQQAATGSKLIDPTKLLHPNTAEKGSRKAQKNNVDKAVEQSQQPVRRVASFTFSLSQADDNDEKVHHHQQKRQSQGRAVAHVATVVQHAKASAKFTLGPIGKTVKKILRPKKDSLTGLPFGAIDLPTLEECNRWQHSFHELLNHKYGLMLFRYFVAIEHSDENLDFWKRCEEFKQLKSAGEWEKAAEKALEIFDQHIATTAENEVNLDSATKVSTQAALEAVGLFAHSVFSEEQKKSPQHVDTELAAVGEQLDAATFNIAQTKIEQLMEKDSYQRFIKSDAYLTLLQQLTEAAEKRQNRRHSSFFGRGNGVSGCLSPTEKTAPAGASFGGRLSPFSSNRIDPTKKRRSTGSASPVDKSAEERQFDSGAFVRSRSVIKSK